VEDNDKTVSPILEALHPSLPMPCATDLVRQPPTLLCCSCSCCCGCGVNPKAALQHPLPVPADRLTTAFSSAGLLGGICLVRGLYCYRFCRTSLPTWGWHARHVAIWWAERSRLPKAICCLLLLLCLLLLWLRVVHAVCQEVQLAPCSWRCWGCC